MRAFDVAILGASLVSWLFIVGVWLFILGVFFFDLQYPAMHRRELEPRVRHDAFCGSSWEAWGELHLCSLSQHHDGNHACQELHPGWPLRCVEKIERQPLAVERSFLRGHRLR